MSAPDLSNLDSLVEEAMAQWQIPGLAIAVVQGDEVIKLQAYGTRDIESRLPATIDTQFMICSLTKSFTAAGLGLLVDEGRLDWSTRIQDILPNFQLYDAIASTSLTVHDLLTHQSGLPRHDRIWSPPGERSRAEILEAIRYLQPSKGFREVNQYCNLGYVVAGAVAEQISGQSWEAFTAERLLRPLGFKSFSFSTDELVASNDHALPHPRRADRVYRGRLWPMHAAPAGGINTSVSDMAKWLDFLLSQGTVNGSQLLTRTVVQQMMTSQIYFEECGFSEIGTLHYGLGLRCEHYRGDRTVSHTGSLPGWSSMMSMMPEHGIGVVVLTNFDPCPVRDLLIYSVFDRLRSREPLNWLETFRTRQRKALDEEERDRRNRETLHANWTGPARPLKCYVGEYEHPAYGAFSMFESIGVLSWRWRGLTGILLSRDGKTFELKEDGDPRFGPPLQVTFQFNADGIVDSLSSPLEPAVADIIFQRRSPPTSRRLGNRHCNDARDDARQPKPGRSR
jgi:CubicO group peptidase (beta-lactamase class C family)